jgi:oxygen-independent coproporphyrinogen-3 oxidase
MEITVECNPAETPAAQLAALLRAGANRVSLGAQAMDARLLKRIGRTHGVADVGRAVAEARRAGFENLSCDLIYGLPGQSLASWAETLSRMLDLRPEHLSVYQLTIEHATPFGRRAERGALRLPEEDLVGEMFEQARDRLGAAGFEHYEVSSYARPGRRAVHNQLYWSGGEYLGLGVSAHSFARLPDGSGRRSANHRDTDAYLAAPSRAIAEREELSPERLARDAAWLGLRRLSDGIDARTAAPFASAIERLLAEGMVERTVSGRVRLSRRGVLFADEVALRFF